MSVPVTSRLDEAVVEALDRAVAAGMAETRAGLISAAVADWLERHGEEAIVASYQRRYADADPATEAVLEAFLQESVVAALDDSQS